MSLSAMCTKFTYVYMYMTACNIDYHARNFEESLSVDEPLGIMKGFVLNWSESVVLLVLRSKDKAGSKNYLYIHVHVNYRNSSKKINADTL